MSAATTELFVEDTGEGDLPVVLGLHSLFLDGRMFDGLADALAGRFRLVRPDFRGQGRSVPADTNEVSMEACAQDVSALVDALGLDAVHVVASSMGGDVALRLAADRPELVRSLVLLGTSAREEPPEHLEAFRPIADEVARSGFQGEILATTMGIMFGATTHADPARKPVLDRWGPRIAALAPELAPAIRGVVERASVVPRLPEIPAPALVVSGVEDGARPPAWADEVVADLPYARLMRLEDAGHSPLLEVPDRVEPAVVAFLEEVEARHR